MRKIYFLFTVLCIVFTAQAQKPMSPKEFLGYELGERFTPHHMAVAYYKHVADLLPNVELYEYGSTYEHRQLVYAVVTSPENFKNLESIRLNNLKRSGMTEGSPSSDKKAIVWMSYNVHGNEASGMEASLQTLYELSDTENTKTQEWLKNTVVILDPCINPDGRDRYANFYRQYGNFPPNSNGDAYEHDEPWPGGRTNHYHFDLNRDWAWATQIESQHRLKVYQQWMPHVHVDFHEQSYNNPYYFAPAAEPFHEVISPWQREFQTMIGKNNAKYFDEQGWLYFTKEVFDLYYPSYGDTYPTYNGAIGMTYEQAGGGFGGLTVTTREGDPLTLKDRLTHHHTTGMSTIEITAKNYSRVVDEFEKYFRENLNNPAAPYKTYVIKATNTADKISWITSWLESHKIQFGHPPSGKATRGFDYQSQTTTSVNLSADDIIFNIYQPKSRFITSVFEPQSKLVDSLTYDITAWNLFYAGNLQGYALNERINVGKAYVPSVENQPSSEKPYAYIFEYKGLKDVAFLSSLMQKGIKIRSAEKAFTANGNHFSPGTLIITRRNNEKVADFDNLIKSMAKAMGRKAFTTYTGFVEKGKDFGSSDVNYLKTPKVAVLTGEQTYSLSAGEIWYFFEQQIHYPITQIGAMYLKNVDLKKYDVLVIPEGSYDVIDEDLLETLSTWVTGGGRLIIISSGLNSFSDRKSFALKTFATDAEKAETEKKEKEARQKSMLTRYEDAERRDISNYIIGAIYKIKLDTSHPLAFGLPENYYTLKTNEHRFAFLESGWNVGVIKGKAKPIQGFAGGIANQKLENSLVFGVQSKGQGQVVYLVDNPLFRCFWEDGKMLFANAVFMVGQ